MEQLELSAIGKDASDPGDDEYNLDLYKLPVDFSGLGTTVDTQALNITES